MDNIQELKNYYKEFLNEYSQYYEIAPDDNFNFNDNFNFEKVKNETDIAVIYYTIAYRYLFESFYYLKPSGVSVLYDLNLSKLDNINLDNDKLSVIARNIMKTSINIIKPITKKILSKKKTVCDIIDDRIKNFDNDIIKKIINIRKNFNYTWLTSPSSPLLPLPQPQSQPPPTPLAENIRKTKAKLRQVNPTPTPTPTPTPRAEKKKEEKKGGYKKKPKNKVSKKKVSKKKSEKKKVSKKKVSKKKVSKKKVSRKKVSKKKVSRKKVSKTPMKSTVTRDGKKYVVRTGDRGGKYIMKNKVKVYL